MPATRRPLADRFWSKVHKAQPNECWLWTGTKNQLGYGDFDNMRAHRVSWTLANGPIPPGLCVLHQCDNPPCVNPAHLRIGTLKDNTMDAWAKGRHCMVIMQRGMASHSAKLTDRQVIDIRNRVSAKTASRASLANEYGLHKTTIDQIVNRRTWTHI